MEIDLSLFPHQEEVFLCEAQNVIYLKGRRAGGTDGAARSLLTLCIDNPEYTALWVDTIYRNIFRYVKRYFIPRLKSLPPKLWNWNGQDMTLSFWNDSYIDFGSYDKPENLEGFGYKHLILNEAGIILWNEDLYNNTLRPMAIEGKGAKWWFIGTPKGRNLYSTFIDRGLDPLNPDWVTFHHTSYINPVVNKEEIDKARFELPDAVFRQEYLAEVLDDANYFRNIDAAFRGRIETEGEIGIGYVIGLDIAAGTSNAKTGSGKTTQVLGDFTVAWVGRTDRREAVFCDRHNRIPWPEQVARIADLAKRFNGAHVISDATAMGGLFAVDDLRAAGVSVQPFTFTSPSKNELMANLATDFEQERLCIYDHDPTKRELKAFQRTMLPSGNWRLEAPPGSHDDCVAAIALMVEGFGRPEIGLGDVITTPGIGAEEQGII